ncbi:MAG: hypothetical protein KDI46_01660 [Alphaproteobacteria bacterium]|nr:hypothetical protein [Alphaproteobacteria bacterium]
MTTQNVQNWQQAGQTYTPTRETSQLEGLVSQALNKLYTTPHAMNFQIESKDSQGRDTVNVFVWNHRKDILARYQLKQIEEGGAEVTPAQDDTVVFFAPDPQALLELMLQDIELKQGLEEGSLLAALTQYAPVNQERSPG